MDEKLFKYCLNIIECLKSYIALNSKDTKSKLWMCSQSLQHRCVYSFQNSATQNIRPFIITADKQSKHTQTLLL